MFRWIALGKAATEYGECSTFDAQGGAMCCCVDSSSTAGDDGKPGLGGGGGETVRLFPTVTCTPA